MNTLNRKSQGLEAYIAWDLDLDRQEKVLEHKRISHALCIAEEARDTAKTRTEYLYQKSNVEWLEQDLDELL
jgi:hypothetical protein